MSSISKIGRTMSFRSAKSTSGTAYNSNSDLAKTVELSHKNSIERNGTADTSLEDNLKNTSDTNISSNSVSEHLLQVPLRKNSVKSLDERAMHIVSEDNTASRINSVADYNGKSSRTSQTSLLQEQTAHIGLGFTRSESHQTIPLYDRLQVGTELRVIKEYVGAETNEMTIEIGDIIELLIVPETENEFWWYGVNKGWTPHNGEKGFFPSKCVVLEEQHNKKQADINSTSETSEIAKSPSAATVAFDENSSAAPGTLVSVVYSYTPTKADEMELTIGETVLLTEAPPGGWWRGTSTNAMASKVPKLGWFPASCVAPSLGATSSGKAFLATKKNSVVDKLKTSASSSSSLNAEAQDGIGSLRTLHRPQNIGTPTQTTIAMHPGALQDSSATTSQFFSLPQSLSTTPVAQINSLNVQFSGSQATSPAAGSTKRMSWYKRLVTKKDSSGQLSSTSSSNTNLLANSSSGTFNTSALPTLAIATPNLAPRSRSWSAPAPNSLLGAHSNSGEDTRQLEIAAQNAQKGTGYSVGDKTKAQRVGSPDAMVSAADCWWKGLDTSELQGLTQKEKLRQMAIFELIVTERDYVRDLATICSTFERPMLEKKLLVLKNSEAIFSNVAQLLKIHQDLLKQLEARRKEQGPIIQRIGDIMYKSADAFVAYHVYCSNHSGSLVKLDSLLQSSRALRNFMEEALKQPQCKGMQLNSFLIKPIQRICKYPLLLKDIMKNTDPDNSDAQTLKSTLDKLELIINLVNEGARQADGVRKMLNIQSKFAEKNLNIVSASRYLIREDVLYLVYGDLRKPRRLFLFNNLLMIARKDWRDKYHVIEKASLEDITVNDIDERHLASSNPTSSTKLDAQPMFEIEVRPAGSPPEEPCKRYIFSSSTQGIKFAWLDAYRQLTQTSVPVKTYTESQNLSSNWDLHGSDDSGSESSDPSETAEELNSKLSLGASSENTLAANRNVLSLTILKGSNDSNSVLASSGLPQTAGSASSAGGNGGKEVAVSPPQSPFSKAAALVSSEKANKESLLSQIKDVQLLLQQEKEKTAHLQKQVDEQNWALQEEKVQRDSTNEKIRFEQEKFEKQIAIYKLMEQDQQRLLYEISNLKTELAGAKDLMAKEVETHFQLLHEKEKQLNEQVKLKEVLDAEHKLSMERLRAQINDIMRTAQEEKLRLKTEHQAAISQIQLKYDATAQELLKSTNLTESLERDRSLLKTSLADELNNTKQSYQRQLDEMKEKLHEAFNSIAKKDAELKALFKEKAQLDSALSKAQTYEQAQLNIRQSFESSIKEKQDTNEKLLSEQLLNYKDRLRERDSEAEKMQQKIEQLQEKLVNAEQSRREIENQGRRDYESISEKAHVAAIERERLQSELLYVSKALEALRGKEIHLETAAAERLANLEQARKESAELKQALELARIQLIENTKGLEQSSIIKAHEKQQNIEFIESKYNKAEYSMKQMYEENCILRERLATDAERIGSLQATADFLNREIEDLALLKKEKEIYNEQSVQHIKDLERKQARINDLNASLDRLRDEKQALASREEVLVQEVAACKNRIAELSDCLSGANASLTIKDDQLSQGQANFQSVKSSLEAAKAQLEKTLDEKRLKSEEIARLGSSLEAKEIALVQLQQEKVALVEKCARLESVHSSSLEKLSEANGDLGKLKVEFQNVLAKLESKTIASSKEEQALKMLQQQLNLLKEANSALKDETFAFKKDFEETRRGLEKQVELKTQSIEKANSKVAFLQTQLKQANTERADVLSLLEKQVAASRTLEKDHTEKSSKLKFYEMMIKEISQSVHYNLYKCTVEDPITGTQSDCGYDEASIVALGQVIHSITQGTTKSQIELEAVQEKLNDALRDAKIATGNASIHEKKASDLDSKLKDAQSQAKKWQIEAQKALETLNLLKKQVQIFAVTKEEFKAQLGESKAKFDSEKQALEQREEKLVAQLAKAESQLAKTESQLAKTESQLAKAESQIVMAESNLADKSLQISELVNAQSQLQVSSESEKLQKVWQNRFNESTKQNDTLQKQILVLQRQLGESQSQALYIIRQLRDRILQLQESKHAAETAAAESLPSPVSHGGSLFQSPLNASNNTAAQKGNISAFNSSLSPSFALSIKKSLESNPLTDSDEKKPSYGLRNAIAPPFAHLDLVGKMKRTANSTTAEEPNVAPQLSISTLSYSTFPNPKSPYPKSPRSPMKSLVNKAASPRLGRAGIPLF